MNKFLYALLLGFLFLGNKALAQPGWSVNPGNYNFNMTVTGVINLNYNEERDLNNYVGAFVGAECIGVAQPIYDANVDRYIVYLMIYSNVSSGETVTFQVYDSSSSTAVSIPNTLPFVVNDVVGTAELPYVWSNPTLSNQAELLTFGFSNQVGLTVFDTSSVTVSMPAGSNLTALTATYTTSPNATVSVNSVQQISGVSVNDFTSVVNYHVVAADGWAQKDYYVYVSVANGIPSDISLSANTINETSSLNSLVAALSTVDVDVNDTHTYTLVSGAGDTDNSSFTINGSNLLLNTTLNYESKSSYSIRIKTHDIAGDSYEEVFNIDVVNQNDEFPQWIGTSITLPENNPLQLVYTVVSTDADSNAAFRVHSYSFVSGNVGSKFSVNATTGEVNLISSLDYEIVTNYALAIKISDGVNEIIDTLKINISDLNDEVPQLASQTIQVLESRLIGEQVFQAIATDADANSVLQYTITNGNTGNAFSINASSGAILVNNTLNFETTPSYTLEINVFDGVNTGIGILTINLVDENEESPIVIDTTVSISESASINTNVVQVIATDNDTASVLSYSIVAGNTASRFTIDPSTGLIKLAQPINYETTKIYFLTVNVSDGVNIGSADITVKVIDENDEFPTIANESVFVSETATISTLVKTVAASDADSGSVFTYSIVTGNNDSKFAINSTTGEITVAALLDYETVSTYTLGVNVNDGVNNGIGIITINVQAVNDELPVVSSASLSLSENATFLQVVHQMVASDPDGGSVLQYSISAGNTGSAFQIDPAFGTIKLIGDLDFETTPSYSLVIDVTDGVHVVNGVVNINLTNENDETPVLTIDTVSIPENMAIGLQVLQILANDADNLSTLTYSIVAGNAGGVFAIEANTGILTLANSLNYENINAYQLTIGVSDGANTKTGTYIINVTDVNDVAPVVQSSNIQVLETKAIGSILHAMVASDVDLNSTLSYSIILGNSEGKFQINTGNGEVSLINALDYETTKNYNLTIEVSDGVQQSNANLVIAIINENDEIPNVVSETVYVPENASLGSLVHNVIASDLDSASTLRYDLVSGNDLGHFSINTYTGKITLTAPLNFEVLNNYNLGVIVSDGLNDSTGVITIIVTDVNDNDPYLADTTISVSETTVVGSPLVTLVASDVDANSTFTYSIIGGNLGGEFLINASSGVISLASALDFENKIKYILEINANDGLNNTSGFVTINITDENDELPSLKDTVLEVSEFANIGDEVGKLLATDKDANSSFTYVLTNISADDKFSVEVDGLVKVAGFIDYEEKAEYTFNVTVSDGVNASTGKITVKVKDENEAEFKATNVFTPNNDGVNEYWEIYNKHLYRDCKLMVYNNIGEIVYSVTGYDNNWNGTSSSGVELPNGTYYYVLNCPSCGDCNYTGFVSIVR